MRPPAVVRALLGMHRMCMIGIKKLINIVWQLVHVVPSVE